VNDMTKRQALEMFAEEWRSFDALVRSLSAAQLDRPVFGEGEGWRVRDIVPHLALWQSISTRVAQRVAERGELPDTPDWDVWAGVETPTPELNDATFREWKGRPIEETLAHLTEAHRAFMAAAVALPPEHVASGTTLPDDLHPFLRAPGVRHLRNHRVHIDSALKEATQS